MNTVPFIKNNLSKTTRAFTLMEVVIVLAIMGVLITIISVASNRFQEQLKQTSAIQEELNHFYLIRSNLWLEMYTSDSIVSFDKTLIIYQPSRTISYAIESSSLQRKQDTGDWVDLKIPMLGLSQKQENQSTKVEFIFDWKGEPMNLHYFCTAGTKKQLDDFFEHYTR